MAIRVAVLVMELIGILLTLLAVYGWGRPGANPSDTARLRGEVQAVDCDCRRSPRSG
jgi:hypothetical protein